jgi:hypothetical protein
MKKLMKVMGMALAMLDGAYANVGVFNGSGQTPIVEKTDAVQMVEEEVLMTPRKAKGPVTGSCRNFDPMDYRCTFKLRNLKDEAVELQVGFPLDIETYRMKGVHAEDVGKLVESFNFSAYSGNEKFKVRFVPQDKEKKFSKLFLWTMRFAAHEERTLVVSYTMEGYLGLSPVVTLDAKDEVEDLRDIDDGLLFFSFAFGIGEAHTYVTGTGSCWAGDIQKATFKYFPQDFEAYLAKRGALDETEEERKQRQEEKGKRGKDAGNSSKGVRNLLRPECRLVRYWHPSPGKWTRKDDGAGRFHYELTFTPFRPSKDDSIILGYVAPPMPTEPDDVDILEDVVREFVKSNGGNEKQYMRDVKDVVLEFYGIKTGNTRIAPFIDKQCWKGQESPDQLSIALRKRLEGKR